jgi:hypothetical protein
LREREGGREGGREREREREKERKMGGREEDYISETQMKNFRAGGVAQGAEHLPSKLEFKPQSTKKKKKNEKLKSTYL